MNTSDDKTDTDTNSHGSLEQMLDNRRRRSKKQKVLFILVGVFVLAGGSFVAYRWLESNETDQAPTYVTATVTRGDLTSTISATASVEALNTVEVGAEISGRIQALYSDFNEDVKSGQLLAEIDPEQHKAAVKQSRAQMLAAKAQVTEAEATLKETELAAERSRGLAAQGLLSAKELESALAKAVRAKASSQSARASAALAEASLDAARSKLEKTKISSPINGTVLSRKVEVGQTINAGMQTPVLFVIAEDLKNMRLLSLVDEADIGTVKTGQEATFTVDAYTDRVFKSKVTSVRNVPQTDQNVVSYEVLLSVDNQELLLKPGMTASVEIITTELKDVMLVPNKALRFSPQTTGSGFRGPRGIPFFGPPRRERKQRTSPLDAIGKLKANQGILWVLNKPAGRGPGRPYRQRSDDSGPGQPPQTRPADRGPGQPPQTRSADRGPGQPPQTRPADRGPGQPAQLRPVVVDRHMSDGVHTAVVAGQLNVGDQVAIELADSDQKAQ